MLATCPECGGILAGVSPGGLCLKCLKRVALHAGVDAGEIESNDSANGLLPETAQARGRAGGRGDSGHDRFGEYELLESIGRGAMGTVFKARHVRLNRLVALKLISHGNQASASQRKRFLREAEAVARLHHQHIVTLYEAGETENQPYLAMEYVPGRTLAQTIGESPLAPRAAAECVRKIAQAVHYAHEQGVLHRDLKPSNVALDLNLEPRVMDFGLARLMEQDSEMTLSGMAIGSPSYMAPEQAAGKVHEISFQSDVYALGAIMYEALTGRPPFQADSSVETMRQVVENEPVSPRLLNGQVPRDLETICLKCLEKERRGRYATARDLADDLGRFLADEPVVARPTGAAAKLARWCRRKPGLSLSLGAAAVLLFIIAVGSPIAVLRINDERKQEAALRVRAESAERRTQAQLYTALLGEARALVHSGELGQRVRALDALRRAAAISNALELRREAVVALTLPDLRFEREFAVSGDTTFFELDPAFERYASGRGSGPVEIHAVSDNSVLATLPPSVSFPVYYGKWSSDGRFLGFKRDHHGMRADVEVWDAARARRVLLATNLTLGAMTFHPRQPWLLTGDETEVTLWDVETGQKLKGFELPVTAPIRLLFSPDGDRFAAMWNSEEGNHAVRVTRTTDGTALSQYAPTEHLLEMDWHPDGLSLAVADGSGAVHLVDSRSGQARLLGRHKAEAAQARFHPEARYLISGGWERELICWDTRMMQRAFTIALGCFQIQLRADGRECAVIGEVPKRVLLHRFETPAAHREFSENLGVRVRSAAFSRDGRWLAASGAERWGVWDLSSSAPGATVQGGDQTRVTFSAAGDLFVQRQGECSRWRVISAADSNSPPKLVQINFAVPPGFSSISLLSDSYVLTASSGSRIAASDSRADKSGDWRHTATGDTTVSPDGHWLAVHPAYRPELGIYRLPDLGLVAVLTNAFKIGAFQFSPRGDEVAAASQRGVEFWCTTNWQRTRIVTNFTDILYAPESRSFWLTKDFNTAGLYDADSLQPLLPLPNGTLPLAASSDGRRLAVSVDMRRLQVWDLIELRGRLRELGLDWASERAGWRQASR